LIGEVYREIVEEDGGSGEIVDSMGKIEIVSDFEGKIKRGSLDKFDFNVSIAYDMVLESILESLDKAIKL
jgi:hypothetical protein